MMNSISTIFTMDFYRNHVKTDASEQHLVRVGRTVSLTAMVIAMALMMQNAFDSLINTGSGPGDGALFNYLGGFALIVVCNAALRWRERVDAEKLGQAYVFDLRQQLFGDGFVRWQ